MIEVAAEIGERWVGALYPPPRALTKGEFGRRVRMEMRMALTSHPDDPERECSRQARGLTADDCELCQGRKLMPRAKAVQAEFAVPGLRAGGLSL